MIRTIYSFVASFHFQGLAFGARKHTMETYGGHATHCQRTTCRDNKRLIDLRLINMETNLSTSRMRYTSNLSASLRRQIINFLLWQ